MSSKTTNSESEDQYLAFQEKLIQSVTKTLDFASNSSGSARSALLKELFDNLISRIERPIIEKMKNSVEWKRILELEGVSCYYEVLADGFTQDHNTVLSVQCLAAKEFTTLLSNNFYPSIVALLFFKNLFNHDWKDESRKDQIPDRNGEKGHKIIPRMHLSTFILGINRLFWLDIENGGFRFRPMFQFLLRRLLPVSMYDEGTESLLYLQRVHPALYSSLFTLLAKFFFYYSSEDMEFVEFVNRTVIAKSLLQKSEERARNNKTGIIEFEDMQLAVANITREVVRDATADLVDASVGLMTGGDRGYGVGLTPDDDFAAESKPAWRMASIEKPASNVFSEDVDFDQINKQRSEQRGKKRNAKFQRKLRRYNREFSDLFVSACISQIDSTRDEEVLIRYLHEFRSFAQLECSSSCLLRLHSALHRFTNPGGPLYTTHEVRAAARGTIDFLFPRGRRVRLFLRPLFRLLNPYYSLTSLMNHILRKIHYGMFSTMSALLIVTRLGGRRKKYRKIA